MKYYDIEPTLKKCVVEYEVWVKDDPKSDSGKIYATKEIGWRTGDFVILVPETEEEIRDWVSNHENWSYDELMQEIKEGGNPFLPSAEDDFIELDDYDYQMNSTWDGCWEEWSVTCVNMSDDERFELAEIIEVESEESGDYIEWLYNNGWLEENFYTEIQCAVKITETNDPWIQETEE